MVEVVAGILIKEGKVLIARRAAHKSMPGKWEFPGGKIEAHESPEAALERELFEEFGVRTQTGRYIGTSTHQSRHFHIKLLAYASVWLSGDFMLTDHDQITWVGLAELPNYDLGEADVAIIRQIRFE